MNQCGANKNFFDIAVIAPMSSGKSTLLNAILQNEILPVSTEATTAKITAIRDTDVENGFCVRCRNRNGAVITTSMPASEKLIKQYNADPAVHFIDIEGNIPFIRGSKAKLRLIDTPGPNNSANPQHRALMQEVLNGKTKPMILFVLDASKPQSNDEAYILKELADVIRVNPRRRLLFVLNMLDQLNEGHDSLEKTIADTRSYLKRMGLPDSPLFPMCAKMAVYLNRIHSNQSLTKKQANELNAFSEISNLSEYADLSYECNQRLHTLIEDCSGSEKSYNWGMMQSGLMALQVAIQDICNQEYDTTGCKCEKESR